MNLKAQDLLVALKLVASEWPGSYAAMGGQLVLSASETHAAFKRARKAGLLHPVEPRPNNRAVAEFLIYAIRYVLAVTPGGRTRGLPTGFAASPLANHFNILDTDRDVPVWPFPDGKVPGLEIQPICRNAPLAAQKDERLYEWLVLADALRGAGRARERKLAEEIVRERLGYHESR